MFVSPWVQCRHRSKLNVTKPRPSHYERRLFEAVTSPIILEEKPSLNDVCSRTSKVKIEEVST